MSTVTPPALAICRRIGTTKRTISVLQAHLRHHTADMTDSVTNDLAPLQSAVTVALRSDMCHAAPVQSDMRPRSRVIERLECQHTQTAGGDARDELAVNTAWDEGYVAMLAALRRRD